MSTRSRVKIVGAGISGLSTAYFLIKKGIPVELYESTDRVGGMIRTQQRPNGIVESAANAFISTALLERISKDIECPLLPTQKIARKRYIYVNSKARRWPLSLVETFYFIIKLPFIFFRKPRSTETVEEWGTRVLSAAVTSKMIKPALQGVYAGDIERMSASLVFGRFYSSKKAKTQDKATLRGSVSPLKGMNEFISLLAEYLRKNGVEIHNNHKVDAESVLAWSKKGPVVIATSMKESARLLKLIDLESSQTLERLETLPLLSCTAFYPKSSKAVEGFGVLFHPQEAFQSLGVLFNHSIFPSRSELRSETWIIRASAEISDETIKDKINEDHERLHKINEKPLEVVINRWPEALPHYTLELEKWLASNALKKLEAQNIFLTGNYLGQLGLSRILESNSELSERILNS